MAGRSREDAGVGMQKAPLPPRQDACLRRLLGALSRVPAVEVAVLVGSLAAGTGDAVSDLDVLAFVGNGRFGEAWAVRHELHGPDTAVCWDDARRPDAGAFRWVGSDGVLVEVLLAEIGSGVRVAPPAVVVLGDVTVFEGLPRRGPIRREESGAASHPVEAAYDAFKRAVRAAEHH